MAFITTVRSRGVKVRLPLNLKNMREVHGVSTCEVPAYAACQVCVCTPTCMCTSVQAERRGEEELMPGLLSGVTGAERMCACSCIFQNYISQQKCPQLTHFSINECVHQIPRITTNPEHRPIPQCNVSRLNVKMWSFTFNAIREQLLFKLKITLWHLNAYTGGCRGSAKIKEAVPCSTETMDGCGININFPLLYINRPQDSPHALLESIKLI